MYDVVLGYIRETIFAVEKKQVLYRVIRESLCT